ncbi:MAG TPA: GH92 family glycosyl hydrolase [Pyrinomonadaceae bacterium]|nr:GH92 family glycosyl hydrolase [Pyrinomonadaceae bacterium]
MKSAKYKRLIFISAIIGLVLVLGGSASAQRQPVDYVNPFIGTGGHGHTFPGATRPFGMVQLSPDTRLTGWDGCSGYHYSDDVIYGFSHTHLSGTGISDYGDILLMPTIGEPVFAAFVDGKPDKGYASKFSHANEAAAPGYYRVLLGDGGIRVELTATNRAGFHRYTYPAGGRANIVLDLQHRDRVLDSYLRVVDATHIEGYRRSSAWAKDQIVYFTAEFSEPFEAEISVGGRMATAAQRKSAQGTNIKAVFGFPRRRANEIMVKVAISAVSIEGAKANLAAELPGWEFDRTVDQSRMAWGHELDKITALKGTDEQLTNFYTALYHTMIAPNLFMDVDGQFRGRDGKIHLSKDFTNYSVFSLWDTFRAAHPLYTIIDQKRTLDFIKTFLAQYDYGGRLPVWELAGNETDTMIGYHSVSVIADAAAKGITGFDREKALVAMKLSAERSERGLDAYRTRGYISMEDDRESVSKTLEYAYDDWCIAQMAGGSGKEENYEDYREFMRRGQFYRHVIDPDTGFARPRRNGGWLTPFDPRQVDFNFTEANAWQYSFFVPHDIDGLIGLMGGREKFARKLDQLFTADSKTIGREQADITGLIGQYAHGNEPSHHMAYLYDYAGEPWQTQARARQIMDDFYKPSPDGLIGNEDCGQMSAWYVLSAAGFYPVTPGSPYYAIGTPLFPEVRFKLENGKTFVIKAANVSARNLYIQSATLNGQPYYYWLLLHRDLMKGGELVFQMGPEPNRKWGSRINDSSTTYLPEFVAGPIIEAPSDTFNDKLEVSIRRLDKDGTIYFTSDGSEPNAKSLVYEKPIVVTQTTTIKALAIRGDKVKSFVTSATFHKLPHNWTIELQSRYSSQYAAGGDMALIDGIRGNQNFSTGAWQGYQGQDFVALIDLGKSQTITKVGAGFLQDVGSWIWMPVRLEFEFSDDGKAFSQPLTIANNVSDKEYKVVVKDLVKTIAARQARYVRVKAVGYGTIPDWHPGKGGHSWIFIDEILVD